MSTLPTRLSADGVICLTQDTLRERLGFTWRPSTFDRKELAGTFPRRVNPGARGRGAATLYQLSDVRDWLVAQEAKAHAAVVLLSAETGALLDEGRPL